MACTTDNNVLAPSPLRSSADSHPYGLSIATPPSSSTSSIFSLDAPSSQSSTASSSTNSVNLIWVKEHENWGHLQSHPEVSQGRSAVSSENLLRLNSTTTKHEQPEVQPLSQAVAPESRKHPRRTHRDAQGNDRNGAAASACPRPPPALVRQCERKDNFVDSLVGKITSFATFDIKCLPSYSKRYHNSNDRDHLAAFSLVLQPRNSG